MKQVKPLTKHWFPILCLVIALIAAAIPLATIQAQNPSNTVTLTVGVPDFMREFFTEKMLGEFEAANPGVKVKVVASSQDVPPAASGIDKHLEEFEKFANSADVLFTDQSTLNSSAITRAGYLLNLAPFAMDDKNLNVEDYYPAAWQSFQWDTGIWVLPVSMSSYILSYNPAAFDKAGIAYPNEKWTFDDLVTATKALAQKDASGKVTAAGLDVFGIGEGMLLRIALGEGLYDGNAVPNPPKLDKPALVTILDTWAKLKEEGYVANQFNKAPISITPVFALMNPAGEDGKRVGALLPGGKAGLEVRGFAVSAGTQSPDKAYALASFLSKRGEIAGFAGEAARKNPIRPQNGNGPGLRMPNLSPEVQQMMDQAANNGIPMAELRYLDYLQLALQKMKDNKLDAKSALQLVEIEAVKAMQTAADKKGKITLTIATPVPDTQVKEGEITLNFGLTSFINPIPNREKWDQVLREFAEADPQVGKVNFNTGFQQGADNNDCFYLPYNQVPDAKLEQLLSLDPFIDADGSFDKSDFVGNVLAQVQRDNKTYALPIMIEPSVLEYHSEKFEKANVPLPTGGWTIDAFTDALKALKVDPKDDPPFMTRGGLGLGESLLSLMASYGALPIDYRSNPPKIDFTNPETVQAIRQVLDLAKNGYIKYEKLGQKPFGMFAISVGSERPQEAIRPKMFGMGFETVVRRGSGSEDPDPYRQVTYPKGRYAAVSYMIGTAYISAKAQNPEACYRLLNTIARHSELFGSMPVRRSLINSSAATRNASVTDLYKQLDELLKDPNTISLPSGFAGRGASRLVIQYWLFTAFDSYVLNDGDLEAALKEAETLSKSFQECMAATPASSDSTQPESIDVFRQCAEKVDPKLKQ